MNTSRLLILPASIVRAGALLAVVFGLASPLRAVDQTINQQIWKMKYGVTDAQLASPAWLAADDDADGLSNGAEISAGTNPFQGGSVLKLTTFASTTTTVSMTFPTVDKKQYVAQKNTNLTNFAGWVAAGAQVTGDGNPKTLTVTKAANTYYRVLVQDLDSDSDGVGDWAETVAGFDPNNSHTAGSPNTDLVTLTSAVATSNIVTVEVTKYSATQPPDAVTPPIDTGKITIRRSGPLTFNTIIVPLSKSGTAAEGIDFDALPSSVTFLGDAVGFTGNETEIVLTVNPKANLTRNTNVTAIVKALGGGGYTLGGSTSGSVVIYPAGNTNGTGLTGQYQNTASSNYNTQVNTIFSTAPEMTRVDATIDFNGIASISTGNPCTITMTNPHGLTSGNSVTISGVTGGTFNPAINAAFTATVVNATTFTVSSNCTVLPTSIVSASVAGVDGPNGWGTVGGPVGLSPASTTGAFSVRWTGQLLPKYSETYFIDFRSDDGAKVWVNGQLIIDRWVNQGATDYINTIDLKAGIVYDIQIDYLSNTGNTTPQARLYWYSASQVKQIVPQNRLFPAPALASKPTAVTSSLDAVGFVGTPFSYSVTNSNIGGAVTYSLAANSGPLPPGLSLNAATGLVSGTPTAAGTYNVAINAQNTAAGTTTGSSVVNFLIYPVGGVTREVLTATGSTVASIVLPLGTPTHDTIATIDDDTDYGTNTGERLRGYFTPPKTGNYYFWIAANNAAELWISNNAEYVNKVRRASVAPAGSGKKVWDAQASQQSKWLYFIAGQKYYFEVLHNTGADADDHVAVGWLQDDLGAAPAVTGAPNPNGSSLLIPNGGAPLQGYPLSGTAPGYAFQPYDYPTATAATGTLYACNLGPQGASTTTASGSSNLRVNTAGTQAILKFEYQGLVSPRTAYHLHVDAFDTHPQGEIVYDIDDVDSFHPELRTPDGGYIWTFAAGGTFPSAASLLDAIQRGKVYLNIHSVTYPVGEIRGNFSLVDGSQTPPNASAYTDPGYPDDHGTDPGAARFLNQASFGASKADVTYVKTNGFAAWINDQLTLPNSATSGDVELGQLSSVFYQYASSIFVNAWWKKAIVDPDQLRQRLAFALSEIMVVSFQDETGPLSRNARALADYYDTLIDNVLPTSGVTDSGTFRGILKAVTLTPGMGIFLDMRGNQKGDLTLGRHPNENYGREIMQLFSIGLYRMWDDGKLILDSKADLVPTYGQSEILGLAATLTGWHYNQSLQASGRLPTSFNPAAVYTEPMLLVPTFHERGAKLLLNNAMLPPATGQTPRAVIASITVGSPCIVNTSTIHGLRVGDTVTIANISGGAFSAAINASHQVTEIVDADSFKVGVNCSSIAGISYTNAVVTGATVTPFAYTTSGLAPIVGSQSDNVGTTLPHPYDQYGLGELDKAIDGIVNNDNVPPYICRLLIQRFVTSSPSPGYLFRVVQKFRDNGAGVRGDMVAVINQILLDGEARNSAAAQASTTFGKQREPLMRVTGPARAFPSVPYTGTYTQLTGTSSHMLQIVTSIPNDFNTGFTVGLDFKGNYVNPPVGQTTDPYNNPTSTSYTISSVSGGNTMVVPATGLSNVTYSQGAGSNSMTVNIAGPETDVPVLGNGATLPITSIATGNPCTITSAGHGLLTGQVVTIGNITDGTFSPAINGNYSVTVVDANTFRVPVNCTVAPTAGTGDFTKTAKSRVYLHFLTQTALGGAALPGSAVYDVKSNGGSTFVVTTTDTPATARAGNVLIPRVPTGETVQSGGTAILFGTVSNHNLQLGDAVWADLRLLAGGPGDGQYVVGSITDEDHMIAGYPPVYPAPIGTPPVITARQNGVILWPLVPPPLGRSGVVTVNQSTFAVNDITRTTDGSLSQTPLNAPTVFNFYFPDYKYPGSLANSNVDSPEFQLSTDTSIVNLTNSVVNMFISTAGGNSNLVGLSSFDNGGGAIVFDIGEFMTSAQTSNAGIPNLIDAIANRLVGGPLSAGVKAQIQGFVGNTTNFPFTTPTSMQMRDRVRAIIHLILSSGEYAIQK